MNIWEAEHLEIEIKCWRKKKVSGYVQGWREVLNQWQGHSETITEKKQKHFRVGCSRTISFM